MSTDRFTPESYEDFLCRGKTARECAEIRDRLAREEQEADDLLADAEHEAERAMKEDPAQPEHFRSNVARDLWEIFTSKP